MRQLRSRFSCDIFVADDLWTSSMRTTKAPKFLQLLDIKQATSADVHIALLRQLCAGRNTSRMHGEVYNFAVADAESEIVACSMVTYICNSTVTTSTSPVRSI